MKFVERLTGIFMKPGETMKDIIKEPRIEEALVIVGIYAIVYMLYKYISMTRINTVYDMPGMDAASGFTTITMVFTLVFSLITPFILWPIVTGLLHLFAMAFGGSGKFYPTNHVWYRLFTDRENLHYLDCINIDDAGTCDHCAYINVEPVSRSKRCQPNAK